MVESTSPQERQLHRSQEEAETSMDPDRSGYHYVKNYDYSPEDFAEQGEVTYGNGVLIHEKSESEQTERFPAMAALRKSDWTVNWSSSARLTDGTILYEGSQ